MGSTGTGPLALSPTKESVMIRYGVWCGVVFLVVAPVRAQPEAPKLVKETWDAAYLEGAKAGYYHTRTEEIERDGRKVVRTTLSMNLRIKRYTEVVPLRLDISTDETPEGKVVGMALTQHLDKGKVLQTARVEGGQLLVKMAGTERKLPWNDEAIGLDKQARLFREKKVQPGDLFDYLNYELLLLAAVRVHVKVMDVQDVEVLEVRPEGDKPKAQRVTRSLLRVEAQSDKVKVGENTLPLPKLVSWLDKDWEIVRSQMEMTGLGHVTLYRTTRAVAEEEGAAPALMPDLGLNNLITLNKAIDRPYDSREIVYRVTVSDDDEPATVFARDDRQEVRNVKGNTFELRVTAKRDPVALDNPRKPKDEFLKSNYFLDSDDARVREAAAKAVGREVDPWVKAKRIEKWVYENMKTSNAVGFATASQICRDLQGDCRQHAMLTAALCRAAGVPSRTAVGLVYVQDRERGPVLGFHMWTEVWAHGQWLAIDATLGRCGIGAGHLKIADHSWQDTQTLAPLLPVVRALGKVKVEVVSVK
jgi:hypothetical protein